MQTRRLVLACLPLVAATLLSGCAVPQPPGKGKLMRLKEPTTQRRYWLYLPESYVARNGRRPDGRKWPLVMTFHGMKPWDNSKPQAREWQEEADRYGFVVCAPDLIVCDTLGAFPVRRGSQLERDEKAILAIMDEVARKTDADMTQVLSTSWSSGGFLAHYMVNRHPERFSCLATRQSNFSADLMDPRRFDKYRSMPIGLYYTTNDFGVCKRDTLRAIVWYKDLGAARLEAGEVQTFGHERTPEVAADFFARTCGAAPRTPPEKLARIRIDEVPREALAKVAPSKRVAPPPSPRARRGRMTNYADSSVPAPSRRNTRAKPKGTSPAVIFDSPGAAAPKSSVGRTGPRTGPASAKARTRGPRKLETRTSRLPGPLASAMEPESPGQNPPFREYKRSVYTPPQRKPGRRTPPRQATRRRASAEPKAPVSVEVSATLGIAPLLIDYAVKLPPECERGADFLWFDNEMPIGNSPSGQKVLTHAGDHTISVLVVTRDDRELRAATKVTVLAPVKGRSKSGR